MKFKLFTVLFVLVLFSCSTTDDSSEPNNPPNNMENNQNNEENNNSDGFDVAFQGTFMTGAHTTIGTAKVNIGETILRLSNFQTDEGPALEVYLATDTNATEYVSLGEIQGVNGDYDYNLPSNIDFNTYNHVIIWCVPFSVNFGYAVLQ